VEERAYEKECTLLWTFFIPLPEGVVDEDPFELSLRASRPRFAPPSVVDTLSWDGEFGLHVYLRTNFLAADDSATKIGLKGKVLLDDEPSVYFNKVCDQVRKLKSKSPRERTSLYGCLLVPLV
jgi:hypothetical protein